MAFGTTEESESDEESSNLIILEESELTLSHIFCLFDDNLIIRLYINALGVMLQLFGFPHFLVKY